MGNRKYGKIVAENNFSLERKKNQHCSTFFSIYTNFFSIINQIQDFCCAVVKCPKQFSFLTLLHWFGKSDCFRNYLLRAFAQSPKQVSAFLLRPFFFENICFWRSSCPVAKTWEITASKNIFWGLLSSLQSRSQIFCLHLFFEPYAEQIVSKWWAIGEWFMSNLWGSCDQVVTK